MGNFLTIKEVAEFLRLSKQSVKRLIENGRLAAHRIGRCSYRIPEDAVTSASRKLGPGPGAAKPGKPKPASDAPPAIKSRRFTRY